MNGKQEFKLVVCEDPETGEWGWCLDELSVEDQPMVGIDPYLIAHDLFEHVNGIYEIGGIAEELEAMGGFWLTRGCHSDVRRGRYSQYDGVEALAATISYLWIRHANGEGFGGAVPAYVETVHDESISEAIDLARSQTVSELGYSDELLPNDDFAGIALSLISSGIAKHEQLYGDEYKANNLFYGFVNLFNGGNLPEVEEYSEEIIKITVDYDDHSVTMEHQEYDYEELEAEAEYA